MMAADSLRSDVPSGMSFCWLLQGEPAEFGKNRTLRFSGHP